MHWEAALVADYFERNKAEEQCSAKYMCTHMHIRKVHCLCGLGSGSVRVHLHSPTFNHLMCSMTILQTLQLQPNRGCWSETNGVILIAYGFHPSPCAGDECVLMME